MIYYFWLEQALILIDTSKGVPDEALAIPISRGKNYKHSAKRLPVLACHLFVFALGEVNSEGEKPSLCCKSRRIRNDFPCKNRPDITNGT